MGAMTAMYPPMPEYNIPDKGTVEKQEDDEPEARKAINREQVKNLLADIDKASAERAKQYAEEHKESIWSKVARGMGATATLPSYRTASSEGLTDDAEYRTLNAAHRSAQNAQDII
ncbi:hypothetical protein EVA_21569, partial [gut metagenome]